MDRLNTEDNDQVNCGKLRGPAGLPYDRLDSEEGDAKC